MNKSLEINNALAIFENAASRHTEAIALGKHRIANKAHDEIVDAVTFLKANNAVAKLKPFLSDTSPGVRLWSAVYLLERFETESINALEEIARMPGTLGFDARMTLAEWKKGNLKPKGL